MKTEHWVLGGTIIGTIITLAMLNRSNRRIPTLGNPDPYWDADNPILKNKTAWKKKNLQVGETAKYRGKDVELDKPRRLPKGSKKKFVVYHQDKKTKKVHRIEWGSTDPNLTVKNHIHKNASSFWARHGCDGYFNRSKKENTDVFNPSKKRFWTCYGPSLFAKELVLSSDKPW